MLDGVLRQEWGLKRVKVVVYLISLPFFMSDSLHYSRWLCLIVGEVSPIVRNRRGV